MFVLTGVGFNSALAETQTTNRYPAERWQQYQSPQQAGARPHRLEKVEKFYKKRAFSGLFVVKNGAVVLDWGENARRFPVHSIRKSLLSALFGIHANDINFRATLAELNITDTPWLTDQERTATVFDILASRSGVYLPAAAETFAMRQEKPARGSNPPGQVWWYNNWDFNVAGTLFQQMTQEEIFSAFDRYLAKPLQMQDYRPFDGFYVKDTSEHQAFQFRMSSRDLARVGLLYARKGNWQGEQILPEAWMEQSTQAISETNMGDKYPAGYGLMWWVEPEGSFSARGLSSHVLAVYPKQDLVIVVRSDSYLEKSVSARATKKLLERVVDAMPDDAASQPDLTLLAEPSKETASLPQQYQLDDTSLTLENGQLVRLKQRDNTLFINYGEGDYELTYKGDNKFFILDRKEPLELVLDEKGKLTDINTPRLFYLQAAAAAKRGDLQQAQAWVEKVIRMSPESAIAYTNLAKLLVAKEQVSVALAKLDIALQLDPNNQQATGLQQTLLVQRWWSWLVGLILSLLVMWRLLKVKKFL
ncbi:serine hydrolase [Planctobacterium marinum]|uniref:Beta-lactamase-related domain-containing protein n=1 Tax=Planctobacterium marinum TaxID=1631968 RepID=A0AA48HZF7_9ALTE|nr:hypothetical protein MACH26_29710 [Planctobacterium marinum]